MNSKKTVFIGVAWPYVNGELHVGHLAGYLLPADICARYNRLVGNSVLMVSGSDCFGTPITVEADKKHVSPKDIVEEYHQKDVDLLLNTLGLSYDLYTKTDTENHIKITQDFFLKLLDHGYVFIDSMKQYFSPSQNKFLPDRYVIGKCPFCGYEDARSDQCDHCGKLIGQGELINPHSQLTSEKVELKTTQHYFVDWPKLQPKLAAYVKTASPNWKDWVRNETLGWLQEGLQPRAITRDLDWGVPIPKDRMPKNMIIENIDSKRIYVWFDAVIGYFSASVLWSEGSGKPWEDFWYNTKAKHYYFMGKDNLVFHTLFWPGQLMEYNSKLHLPDVASINMFLNFGGKQFSKSRGVMLRTKDLVEQYGNDRVRFYLTMVMPEYKDASFAWEDFQDKVNNVLVANLGNFIHRSLSVGKNLGTSRTNHPLSPEIVALVETSFKDAKACLENCEFRKYLEVILSLSTYGNKLIDKEKLWDLAKNDTDKANSVLHELYSLIVTIGLLSAPLMPDFSQKLFTTIGLNLPSVWPNTKQEAAEVNRLVSTISITSPLTPPFQKIAITEANLPVQNHH